MGLFQHFKSVLRSTTNLTGYIDTDAAEKAIRNNIYFRGPNVWILAIAIIIASIGLNVNSIPVVIGAMLISPLMGPIFGLGLGLGVNDVELMKSSGKNLVTMVCISLAASTAYFLITPLSLTNPTELLARTNPTIYDVFIALIGGFAGILEQCRKEKGTVFSGVAIATALMPPLCTAGFSIACGNLTYFLGALYLFFINCLFIMLATYISVKYFKFRQVEFEDPAKGKRTKRVSTVIILIFIIPSIWSAVTLIQRNNFEKNASEFIGHSKAYNKSVIYDYKIQHAEISTIELFFTGEPLNDETKEIIYRTAAEFGLKEENIIMNDHAKTDDFDDLELVKGIYDKMDAEVAKRDDEIRRLKDELKVAKGTDIPYLQIAREIANTYPAVREVYLSQGAHVHTDSLHMTSVITLVVRCDTLMVKDEYDRLNEWLKIRLNVENVLLMVDVIEKEAAEIEPAVLTVSLEQPQDSIASSVNPENNLR